MPRAWRPSAASNQAIDRSFRVNRIDRAGCCRQQATDMAAHTSPDFIAEIYLVPTESGGCDSHLSGGEWRSVVEMGHEFWSATLHFDGEHLQGEWFEVEVRLLLADVALPMMEAGMSFAVWEDESQARGVVTRLTRRSGQDLSWSQDRSLEGIGVVRAGAAA
ncbi:hypothetical protein [Dyella sp. EPa41]|uniref:hypothetical protein n=1 Tax=Dyella sp. EPa41 TaxID=1561194 RepID=UPI001915C8B5|nr:hypothetical protein [Dyella sp. EPa41]